MPTLEKSVFLEFVKLFTSITPLSVDSNLLIISPLLSTYAEIPLLAERIIFFPSSIALKIECVKCWEGPTELPNQPSSEIFIIKLKFVLFGSMLPE